MLVRHERRVRRARERLQRCEQPVAAMPVRERRGDAVVRVVEPRQLELGDDAVFQQCGLRIGGEGGHARRQRLRRRPVAVALGEQDAAPQHENLGIVRIADRRQLGPRFRRAVQQQQRECPVRAPMRAVAPRRRLAFQQRERGGGFVIQQMGIGTIEPRRDAARFARQHGGEAREGRLGLAAQQLERREIGGGRVVRGVGAQGRLHRRHRHCRGAEPIIGKPEFHPRIGERRPRAGGGVKRVAGAGMVAGGGLGAAEHVERIGIARRPLQRPPRRRPRRRRPVERDQGGGEVGPRCRAVGRQHRRPAERGRGARRASGREQRDAVVQMRERLGEIEPPGAGEQRQRGHGLAGAGERQAVQPQQCRIGRILRPQRRERRRRLGEGAGLIAGDGVGKFGLRHDI